MTRMPHDLRSGICPSVDDPAYLAHKVLDDGRHVCLVVGPANTQLVVGPPCEEQYVAERWSYETILAGLIGFIEWDGTGDPPGEWIRHQPSNRRRAYLDGELIREWVAK